MVDTQHQASDGAASSRDRRRAARRRPLRVALGLLALAIVAAPLLTQDALKPIEHFAENRPANIAHGGAAGHAPANTLEAFTRALELGADTLEMDLQLTADGQVVVHHDGTVDRQTDGSGALADLTLDEIRDLDAGFAFVDDDGTHPFRGAGITIPTLEEVFDAFPDAFMVLEMKTDGGQDIVAAVTERVRDQGREDTIVLASFDLDYIEEARRRLPDVATTMPEGEARAYHVRQVVGLHRWWSPPGELLQVPEHHDGLHVATHRFFTGADEIGVDAHVWTVNERDDMRRLLAAGAHGIITDYPDRMAAVIDERDSGQALPDADRGDVALVEWLQDRLGWLTPVMRAITFIGDEDFYVLGFPLVYWAVSRRVGVRLGVMLLLSASLNEAGKIAGRTPRPSFVDPGLGLVSETTPGIPSGHAQNGVVVWGVLASEVRRRWAWGVALVLIVLLALSRVHLGVHYPVDLLVGWAVGMVLLLGYLRLCGPAEAWLAQRRPAVQVWLSLALSLGLVALAVAGRLLFLDWQPPVEWVGIDPEGWPVGISHTVTPAGALFGVGVGTALLRIYGGFSAAGPLWQRTVRCLVGLVGVMVLWQGLGLVFPSGEDAIALTYRWLRYAAVGAWITGVAPLLFVRLGLAPRETAGQGARSGPPRPDDEASSRGGGAATAR